MNLIDAVHRLLDAEAWLQDFGPWILLGVAVLIFIESGVLFPFLPGDSLLVTAAILAPSLGINPWIIALVAFVAAFLGDQVGYWLGAKFGRRLFKPDARVLKSSHLDEAHKFFEKWGGISLVLGRFVPIVRTYVPLVAGMAEMPYRRFLAWNVSGAAGWVGSMTLVGTLLGGIPGIQERIDVIAIIIVVLSVLPIVITALVKHHKNKKAAAAAVETATD